MKTKSVNIGKGKERKGKRGTYKRELAPKEEDVREEKNIYQQDHKITARAHKRDQPRNGNQLRKGARQ